MKKKLEQVCSFLMEHREKIIIMRNAVIILLISTFQVLATGSYSQTTQLSMRMRGATVKEVLLEIEDQSEFYFLYNSELVDVARTVDISVKKEKVDDVLAQLFDKNKVSITINDRHIVLTPVDEVVQQQKSVSGKVTDESGQTLPGVTVLIKGTTHGTVTDVDGNYSISNIPEDAALLFSFVGMHTQETIIGNQTAINITMVVDAVGIEEVVAIGYGTQRKVNLTGSISSVNSEFIESRPMTNSTQALQAVNGVYVNQVGGQPGADNATIRIRGIGTLNNNDPLVLVDGIQYNLRDVNPNDIESISVLKDAASASIYGNRAANGVILVTTKTGKVEKMKIELNSYFGVQQATYLPDMVTNSVDYMTVRNEASFNEGQPVPYSDEQINAFRTGTDPIMYPNTDWFGAVFSAAPMQDHNIRLSGGTESVVYSMSLEYLNQEGIMIDTDAKKYSLNSNVIFKPSDKLEFGAIISGSYWDRNESYEGSDNVMERAARSLPIQPNFKAESGNYADVRLVTPGHNAFYHPVAIATEGIQNNTTQRVMVNFFTQYIFPLDIKYKVNFAVNKYDAYNHKFIPTTLLYKPEDPENTRQIGKRSRSVEQTNSNSMNTSFFQTLNWTKKVADQHGINLLLGFSMESFYNSNSDGYVEGFLGNELTELNAGTINMDVGGTSYESKLMSYFGRANYSYADKYLVEFNFRYDGSSRFAANNRWGFFPSVSAGWRVNEEAFMQNVQSINNLKLRVSWGQLGNQNISLYSFLNNININQGTSFNNTVVAGSAVTALSDPDISWETSTITNVGLDVGLFDSKLDFTVDVFDKKTTDILARINVPGQVGNLSGPITNLYSMSNKGFEIGASYRNSTREFTYTIGANIAYVDNNVDFLDGDIQYETNRYGNISVIKEGFPVNSWYLYESLGLFQTVEEVQNSAFQHSKTSPGDIKYRDYNEDDVIDINDMRVMGRSVPKYTYSFNLNIEYKGFDLGALFQGVQGIDIYPWHNVSWPVYNGAGITKEHIANYWTPENPDAKYPRMSLYKRGSGINSLNSTFWLKDASYLRLKNLQLGYTLPTELANKINSSKIRVYVNAQNFLTFSKYNVTDPEKDILQEDIFNYPSTKIFTAGFSITF